MREHPEGRGGFPLARGLLFGEVLLDLADQLVLGDDRGLLVEEPVLHTTALAVSALPSASSHAGPSRRFIVRCDPSGMRWRQPAS